MAKTIKQFRYFKPGSSKNQPSANNYQDFVTGNVFGDYLPFYQIGIQAIPGTKFYLNNAVEPVIIGSTGIYELDLDGLIEITNLQFNEQSMQNIENNENAYLIVDVIWNKEVTA